MDNCTHIYPIDDSKKHVFASDCHCEPSLVLYEGEHTVIHNPYDLRDFWEQDKQIINELYMSHIGKKPAWGKEGRC